MRILKILIADDEPLNRDELRFLLEQHEDIEIVGEADSASGVCQGSCRLKLKIMPPCFPLFQSYLYPG